MKQTTAAAALLALGLVLGQAMPQVLAQAPQPQAQKWQQFCEEEKGRGGRLNERLKAHGARGFALVSVIPVGSNYTLTCYRRPAQ